MNSPTHSPALDPLLSKLKQAREARQMTLTDVADATLIGLRFLELIEEGDTTFLPQTYVRAFIREYASVVGLDPDAIIQEYDSATGSSGPETTVAPPEREAAPPPSTPRQAPLRAADAHAPTQAAADGRPGRLQALQLGAAVVVIAIVGVIMWNILGKTQAPVNEVPFSSVIAENERKAAAAAADSAAASRAAASRDSLVLKAQTSDSVWIRMSIDAMPPREYYIWPRRSRTWKARDRFLVIAMGNPTAIQFTLNGKQLGSLGRKGTVVRNKELNRSTLQER